MHRKMLALVAIGLWSVFGCEQAGKDIPPPVVGAEPLPAPAAAPSAPANREPANTKPANAEQNTTGSVSVRMPEVEVRGTPSEAGSSPATRRTGEDWAEFLGPRGNGVSGETGLLGRWPAAGPPVLWKKRIGTGYSSPAIRGNRLVVHHRPLQEEVVECLTADGGEPLWKYSYPSEFVDPYGYNNGPRCSPVLTAERCYTFGPQGKLLCLDLATGKKIWERDTATEFEVPPPFFGVGSTPLLEGNLLLVMVGGHPDSGIVAFDATSGKTVWHSIGPAEIPPPEFRHQRDRPPAKLASYASPLCATIHGQRHLLCLMRPGLISLDPQTGRKRFAVSFRSPLHDSVNAAQPLVLGDEIFLSAAYDVGAMLLKVHRNGEGYETLWRDELLMQNHWSTSVFKEGYVYGFSGRHKPGSTFRCVDLRARKVQWEVLTPETVVEGPQPVGGAAELAAEHFGRGSLIQVDGKFIALGETGLLALVEINPRQYVELARVHYQEMTYPSWAAPILSRGRLYLRSEHHLLCLDLKPVEK